MAKPGDTLLRCEKLRVGYRGRAILPPIDLDVRAGELWVVIGRNGSGKTTLFRTMLGLLPPVSGRVERASADTRFSYVAQRASFDDLFPLLGRTIVRMGVERKWSFTLPLLTEPPIVMRALEQVGAKDLADKPFRALSEGQKQRVLLARLAASEPELALLDEPTAAMDAVAEREAFGFLDQLKREQHLAIIVVSHYLDIAREFADRAVLLDRDSDSIVIGTPDEVLGHRTFRKSYRPPPMPPGAGDEEPSDA